MIEASGIPAQRDNFRFQEMDDESLLFNEVTKRTVYLNQSATVIWKLCDGRRSIGQIIALLNESYAEEKVDFETDVREAVERLLHEGALKWMPVA